MNTDNLFADKNDLLEIHSALDRWKKDIIKWMFIFWLGQILVLSGIMISFLKWESQTDYWLPTTDFSTS